MFDSSKTAMGRMDSIMYAFSIRQAARMRRKAYEKEKAINSDVYPAYADGRWEPYAYGDR